MTLTLGLYVGNTEFVEFLYIQADVRPGIFIIDEFQYFILSKVTSENIVMIILEYSDVKIISRQYIDSVNKKRLKELVNQQLLEFSRCFAVKVLYASVDQISRQSLLRSRMVVAWIEGVTRTNTLRDIVNFL